MRREKRKETIMLIYLRSRGEKLVLQASPPLGHFVGTSYRHHSFIEVKRGRMRTYHQYTWFSALRGLLEVLTFLHHIRLSEPSPSGVSTQILGPNFASSPDRTVECRYERCAQVFSVQKKVQILREVERTVGQ